MNFLGTLTVSVLSIGVFVENKLCGDDGEDTVAVGNHLFDSVVVAGLLTFFAVVENADTVAVGILLVAPPRNSRTVMVAIIVIRIDDGLRFEETALINSSRFFRESSVSELKRQALDPASICYDLISYFLCSNLVGQRWLEQMILATMNFVMVKDDGFEWVVIDVAVKVRMTCDVHVLRKLLMRGRTDNKRGVASKGHQCLTSDNEQCFGTSFCQNAHFSGTFNSLCNSSD